MHAIKLKEYMGLPNYTWPRSVVTYPLTFEADTDLSRLMLTENGECLPLQVSNVKKNSDGTVTADVSFVTDLPCGAEKTFCLESGETAGAQPIGAVTENGIVLRNEHLTLTVSDSLSQLFCIQKNGTSIKGVSALGAPVCKKEYTLLENGGIFAVAKVSVEFSDGETYAIEFRLEKESEAVILTETIGTSGKTMLISWQGFAPTMRTSCGPHQNKRPIDAHLTGESKLPVRVLPHDVTSGVVESPFMGCYNDTDSVGMFVGDANLWDDGVYSIQSNNAWNAITFYYREEDEAPLSWSYPLNKGSRQTGIALYNSENTYQPDMKSYLRQLQFFHVYVPLNKYKDWVFEYDDSEEHYPIYFDKAWYKADMPYHFVGPSVGIPPAQEVWERIRDLEIVRRPWHYGPVWSRVSHEIIPLLDMRAGEMSREDFVRTRNVCIFFAYYSFDENPYPSRHTLAGHANFFMDYVGIVGMACAMFPKHPMAQAWKQYYERAIALTLKFYVRPDVKTWKAKGGRFTESLGTYNWGCLGEMLAGTELIKKVYGDDPMLHPNFVKWAQWLLDSLSAPLEDGRRAFPPMGAHAGGHRLNPHYPNFYFRVMGKRLEHYAPELSQKILNACKAEPLLQFERHDKDHPWAYMHSQTGTDDGVRPDLKSEKYTGFGYALRSHVGQPDEMCVMLQQIDAGNNYRWGISCDGGCGNLYYYADGKRFSDNRKEDVGDDSMRDCEVSCNFGALIKLQQYKSVGQNELTNPLVDLGLCQYARVDAGEYSNEEYRFRSVLMADNDYIAVYDAVRDCRTAGKFSWFSNTSDPLPNIWQLKPGVQPRYVDAPALTILGTPFSNSANGLPTPNNATRGVVFDGGNARGDFFTVVSHREDLNVAGRDFGAVVEGPDFTDYVFDANYRLNVQLEDIHFKGKVGYVRKQAEAFRAALIDGQYLRVGDAEITVLKKASDFSISMEKRDGAYLGKCVGKATVRLRITEAMKLFVGGREVPYAGEIELEDTYFELTDTAVHPQRVTGICYEEQPDGIVVHWSDACADTYTIRVVNGNGQAEILETNGCSALLKLPEGKYRVQVQGINGQLCGPLSGEHPVFVTGKVPAAVEGLQVKRNGDHFEITWGRQLGVTQYHLYGLRGGEAVCIYSGKNTALTDAGGFDGYFATAENGFGEGPRSVVRDTAAGGACDWDPLPNVTFLRDTIINEHGFAGFDYARNERRTILFYPD